MTTDNITCKFFLLKTAATAKRVITRTPVKFGFFLHLIMKEVENVAIPMHSNLRQPRVAPVVLRFNFEVHGLMHHHTKLQLIRG